MVFFFPFFFFFPGPFFVAASSFFILFYGLIYHKNLASASASAFVTCNIVLYIVQVKFLNIK